MVKIIIRALRLPFVTASALPFVFGSLLAGGNFNFANFLLGFMAAVSVHLSANLINDYADSKSGADWQDKNFYKFFGGSKLIQEQILSERFYLNAAVIFALLAAFCILALSLILESFSVIIYYLLILALGWSYSAGPFAFSYRKMGELIIFLLFGPALVMGGYFIQTKIFPTLEGFITSLAFGLFTTAILFANEVPDFSDDLQAHKFNWVSIVGKDKSYLIYSLLVSLGFLSIAIAIIMGYLGRIAFFSFIFVIPAFKAKEILKKFPSQKSRLVDSSKLTVALQAMVSLVLILSLLLR